MNQRFPNKAVLDKISERNGLPRWDKGPWPANSKVSFVDLFNRANGPVGEDYTIMPGFSASQIREGKTCGVFAANIEWHGISFNRNRTRMYLMVDNYSQEAPVPYSPSMMYQYDLSTAGDPASAALSGSLDLSSIAYNPRGITWNDDYTMFFIVDNHQRTDGQGRIVGVPLSDAEDITTADFNNIQTLSTARYGSDSGNFIFNVGPTVTPGTKGYLYSLNTQVIYQMSFSTPYDLSTYSDDGVSLDVSSIISLGNGLQMPSESKMYVAEFGNDRIYQFSLLTPSDVSMSSAAYDGASAPMGSPVSQIADQFVSSDGVDFYELGYRTGILTRYQAATPYSVLASFSDVLDWTISSEPQPMPMCMAIYRSSASFDQKARLEDIILGGPGHAAGIAVRSSDVSNNQYLAYLANVSGATRAQLFKVVNGDYTTLGDVAADAATGIEFSAIGAALSVNIKQGDVWTNGAISTTDETFATGKGGFFETADSKGGKFSFEQI